MENKTNWCLIRWRGDGMIIPAIVKSHYRHYPKYRRKAFTFDQVFVKYISEEEYNKRKAKTCE